MGDAIAWKDAAEVTLANQEPALFEMHRYTCSPRAFDEMDVTAKLPITHPVAQPHDGLEQPCLMSRRLMMRLVILPQAIRVVVPPLGNYFISLFKDTSLVSIVTVKELMFTGQIIAATNFQYFTIFTIIGIIYFSLSYPSSLFVSYLERRMKIGYRRKASRLARRTAAGRRPL